MIKLIALYRQPADVESFMRHYLNVHLPLVEDFVHALVLPHLK